MTNVFFMCIKEKNIFTFFSNFYIFLQKLLTNKIASGTLLKYFFIEGFYMKDLETERLILRKFKKEDLDDMYKIASNKKVAEHSDFKVHESKEDTLFCIECAIKDYGSYESCWAIEKKDDKKTIGYIRIYNVSLKNKQCTLTWALAEECWRLGYSEEILKSMFDFLFNNYPFDIIIAKYYTNYAFTNHILENAGMKRDAILRDRRINSITGNKESLVIYSILKEEIAS